MRDALDVLAALILLAVVVLVVGGIGVSERWRDALAFMGMTAAASWAFYRVAGAFGRRLR